jgi:hypothetical protein
MDEPVLKNLWDADVPASDPHFTVAVMARIEQRRFRRELATTVSLGAAATLLLALVMPALEFTWLESVISSAGNLAMLAIFGALMLPQLSPARD